MEAIRRGDKEKAAETGCHVSCGGGGRWGDGEGTIVEEGDGEMGREP